MRKRYVESGSELERPYPSSPKGKKKAYKPRRNRISHGRESEREHSTDKDCKKTILLQEGSLLHSRL